MVWGHCFEMQLMPQSFERWPKAQLRIWKLDRDHNFTVHAFGSFFFPLTPGHREISVECWSPVRDILSLQNEIFNRETYKPSGDERLPPKEMLTVRPSGTVYLQLNSVFRNFDQTNVSYT